MEAGGLVGVCGLFPQDFPRLRVIRRPSLRRAEAELQLLKQKQKSTTRVEAAAKTPAGVVRSPTKSRTTEGNEFKRVWSALATGLPGLPPLGRTDPTGGSATSLIMKRKTASTLTRSIKKAKVNHDSARDQKPRPGKNGSSALTGVKVHTRLDAAPADAAPALATATDGGPPARVLCPPVLVDLDIGAIFDNKDMLPHLRTPTDEGDTDGYRSDDTDHSGLAGAELGDGFASDGWEVSDEDENDEDGLADGPEDDFYNFGEEALQADPVINGKGEEHRRGGGSLLAASVANLPGGPICW